MRRGIVLALGLLVLSVGSARAEDSVRCVPRANEWAANRSLWRENRPALLDFRSRVPSNLCPGLIAEVDRAIASASAEVVAPAPPANPCAAADGRWSSLRASRDRAALQDFIDTTPTQCGARDAAMGRLASLAPPPVAKPTQTYNPPVAASRAPYDLGQLDPSVRSAASSARAAAAVAREAAVTAEDAARRARNGETGYRIFDWPNDNDNLRHYEGGWSDNARNGYGTRINAAGDYAGDRYAGGWRNGLFSGYGVYYYSTNKNNAPGAQRFEGQVVTDKYSGYGAFYWNDGKRYEGAWADNTYNGYGVLWSADGRVLKAGLWSGGNLSTPIGAQGP